MFTLNTMPPHTDIEAGKEVTVIETSSRAVFDAITDEAMAHNPLASAYILDDIARIEFENAITIAVLFLP